MPPLTWETFSKTSACSIVSIVLIFANWNAQWIKHQECFDIGFFLFSFCFLSLTAVYPHLTRKCFLSGNLVLINKILLSAPTQRHRNPWAYLIDSFWFKHHLCCSCEPSASANKCTVNMKKFAHTSLLGISLLLIGPDSTALPSLHCSALNTVWAYVFTAFVSHYFIVIDLHSWMKWKIPECWLLSYLRMLAKCERSAVVLLLFQVPFHWSLCHILYIYTVLILNRILLKDVLC